jgi:CheY-like chemotaxis protein
MSRQEHGRRGEFILPTKTAASADTAADKGAEDLAGITALAELVALRDDAAPPLSVPVSALIDTTIRRPAALDASVESGLAVRPRVLLVEDSPVNRLMVGVLLDQLGLDHVAVGCAEEALFRFAREAFDAILIDVEMDGTAGLATARVLSELAGEATPPLVALGRADLDVDSLVTAGFSAVADSPLDARRLGAALIVAVEYGIADDFKA